MQSLSTILLMVERGEQAHVALVKALTLARHAGAQLELFLCETEPYLGEDSSIAAGRDGSLKRGQEYLRSLRDRILCSDVPIAGEVAWAPSLIQGVAEKLRRTPAQMVVRAAGRFDAVMAAFARHFVNRCGTPLLLTRGRPWQPAPRFVAVLSPGLGAGLVSQIGRLSEFLKRRSGAQVEYAIGTIGTTEGLPGILAARNYDLMILALPPSAASQDADTARLLQTSVADVLLVAAEPVVSADSSATSASLGSAHRRPL